MRVVEYALLDKRYRILLPEKGNKPSNGIGRIPSSRIRSLNVDGEL